MARKKKTDRIPFTEDEVRQIQESPIQNLRDLAFVMNRSYESVRNKKWRLDHPERAREIDKRYKRQLYNRTTDGGKRNYLYWTKEEIDLILTSKESDLVLAEKLGRSLNCIQTKRYRLLKGEK